MFWRATASASWLISARSTAQVGRCSAVAMPMQPEPVHRSSTPSGGSSGNQAAKPVSTSSADGRARDQHPLVDVEGQAGEPRLAEQVGQRTPAGDPFPHQGDDAAALHGQQAGVEHRRVDIPGQVQRAQGQGHRFVPGRVAAVAMKQPGQVELAGRPAQAVAQGDEFRGEPLVGKRKRGGRARGVLIGQGST